MKTKTIEANKVALAPTKEIKKISNSDLENLIILQKSKINVSDKEKSVTKTKEKNFIYKFQLDSTLKEKEQKKERSKLRRQLTNILNTIIIDNLKEQNLTNVPLFIDFYKKNYISNDFTKESISNSTEETKVNDINLVLSLTKLFLSKENKIEIKKEKVIKKK